MKLNDLTGQKFGRLTVLERAESQVHPSGKTTTMWKCICDCQLDKPDSERKYSYVNSENLRNGKTKSCGCLHKERTSLKKKKYNRYDLSGEFGKGYDDNGNEFWFDLEDYEKIYPYFWNMRYDGYFVSIDNRTGKGLRLHRLVMGVDDPNILVDHIKHSLYDNRKSQLRLCNKRDNARNHKKFSTNVSGETGVSWSKGMKAWTARICVNYKDIALGYFDNKEDAIKARKDAENQYFGEWSYDNSQQERGGV